MLNRVLGITLAATACGLAARPAAAEPTPGECLPAFELTNFQPASPTYLQSVKSSSYFDHPTVIVLLSAA